LFRRAARQSEWNLPPFPDDSWYSTRLLAAAFCVLARSEGQKGCRSILKSPIPVCCGIAYLTLALVMTMASRLPGFGKSLPIWRFDAFDPNDKTNLAPYRVLHFVVMVFVVGLYRRTGVGWNGRSSRPSSYVADNRLLYFASGSSTLVAYYISWSEQQDDPHRMASADAHS
jgi:OpgC protein